jgi:hypothetical protein
MDMLIYRIENGNGVGFGTKLSGVHCDFRGELSVWSVVLGNGCSYDLDANIHPGPNDDDSLIKNLNDRDITKYSFAFASAKQMREWLYRDKWLVALEKYGMVVSTYIIDSQHVILGDKQCLYLPDKVSYKTEESISEYFGLD